MSKFEVYKDKKGETRFRYRAKNGEIVFSSEGYKAKASAMKSIESLKKNITEAVIEVIEDAKPKPAAKAKPAAAPKAAAKPAKAAAAAKPAKAAKAKAPAKPKAAKKP